VKPRGKPYTLQVEQAVPALELMPGDVLIISEGGADQISVYRPIDGRQVPEVCQTILRLLDQGHLTPLLPETSHAILLALSRMEGQTPPQTTVDGSEKLDLDAALARLAVGSGLPREECGATLTWLAIERERGYGKPDYDEGQDD